MRVRASREAVRSKCNHETWYRDLLCHGALVVLQQQNVYSMYSICMATSSAGSRKVPQCHIGIVHAPSAALECDTAEPGSSLPLLDPAQDLQVLNNMLQRFCHSILIVCNQCAFGALGPASVNYVFRRGSRNFRIYCKPA
jgi:hypothetical protein